MQCPERGHNRCHTWTLLEGLLGRRKPWDLELRDTPDPLPEKENESHPLRADVWGGARMVEGGGINKGLDPPV